MKTNPFKNEVLEGLKSNPKTLPSKYFYDAKGDELFVRIMNLPEYYLTRSEFEILQNKSEDIIKSVGVKNDTYFELIELGAGDGKKTKELLKTLIHLDFNFSYLPIDISQNALDLLKQNLETQFNTLSVKPKQGKYFEVLEDIKANKAPKVIMFLGSNLGNMPDDEAQQFMEKLSDALQINDKVILGLDLIKSKDIVLPAYNDAQGVTKAFNMNLLNRINNELNADFNLDYFDHQPEYSEETGIAKSFLVSKVNQNVSFNGSGVIISFKKGEKIHTEISRKYNASILNTILGETKFKITDQFLDSKNYFSSYILERN